MPTTPGGIVYPDSSAHTRIWEHLEAQAESIDAALGGETDKAPRGRVGYAVRGAIQGIDTVHRSLLTAAVVVPAGRHIKVTVGMLFNNASAAQNLFLGLAVNDVEQTNVPIYVANANYYPATLTWVHQPAAGTHNYSAYAWTTTGTAQINAGPPNFVLVEDVGGV